MNKLLIRIILTVFIPLLIAANLIFITSCQYSSERKFPPKAINGIIDLKNWDFEKNALVDLSGEWEFYWNKHLTPADFTNHNPVEKTGLINVPGCWNGYILDGKPLSGDGYATYRLKILMPDQKGSFAFNKLDIGTAGATSLVFQTIFLPLSLASSTSSVIITGGTHVPWSPCFHFLENHWLYYLRQIGFETKLSLDQAGFYPAGGGRISATIRPAVEIRPLNLTNRGALLSITGISAVANLKG